MNLISEIKHYSYVWKNDSMRIAKISFIRNPVTDKWILENCSYVCHSRDHYDIDFTEGGNDQAYDWVPKGEVWIDDDVEPNERSYIIFHELHERGLMLKGEKYDQAHKETSKLEQFYRQHPGELQGALDRLGYEKTPPCHENSHRTETEISQSQD